MNVEDELRRSLKHKPAPADLVAKVLARAALPDAHASAATSVRRAIAGRSLATMAACALLAVGATRIYVARATAAEAERATAQVRIALEIASEKLVLVQRRIHDVQP